MEITGTYDLRAHPEKVWSSMMEPEVLMQCIPACQVIEKHSEQEFNAQVRVKFGPIPVRFNVRLTLSNMNPPSHYALTARADGGLANAAKATGNVEFKQLPELKTRVIFIGRVLPGSKLFELGEPLVQRTAKKWFRLFFERFERELLQETDRI